MIKVRFHTSSVEDYRPIKWPIKHPYWCTGFAGDMSYAILVAYVDSKEQLLELWPEAYNLDVFEENVTEYKFSGRFPKPEWLN